MQPPPKKLLDLGRDAIRLKHYTYRPEETYVQWIRRFILLHNQRHPLVLATVSQSKENLCPFS
jgi:hypothetical protein